MHLCFCRLYNLLKEIWEHERRNMVFCTIFSFSFIDERERNEIGKNALALLKSVAGVKQIEVMNINSQKPIAFVFYSQSLLVFSYVIQLSMNHTALCRSPPSFVRKKVDVVLLNLTMCSRIVLMANPKAELMWMKKMPRKQVFKQREIYGSMKVHQLCRWEFINTHKTLARQSPYKNRGNLIPDSLKNNLINKLPPTQFGLRLHEISFTDRAENNTEQRTRKRQKPDGRKVKCWLHTTPNWYLIILYCFHVLWGINFIQLFSSLSWRMILNKSIKLHTKMWHIIPIGNLNEYTVHV